MYLGRPNRGVSAEFRQNPWLVATLGLCEHSAQFRCLYQALLIIAIRVSEK